MRIFQNKSSQSDHSYTLRYCFFLPCLLSGLEFCGKHLHRDMQPTGSQNMTPKLTYLSSPPFDSQLLPSGIIVHDRLVTRFHTQPYVYSFIPFMNKCGILMFSLLIFFKACF